jgi:hypothetical protein
LKDEERLQRKVVRFATKTKTFSAKVWPREEHVVELIALKL